MADSLAHLERRRAELIERHANELQEIDDKIGTIKFQEVEALKTQAAALGFSLTSTGSARKIRKSSGERRPATCSLCRNVGLSGEGHTARIHDKWLESQPVGAQNAYSGRS